MAHGRFALLVASSHFDDHRLRELRSSEQDIRQLASVLSDPEIGDFDVSSYIDCSTQEVRRALDRFFQNRDPNDFLILYVSSHGLKDENGNLFFAAKDTNRDELNATTFEAHLIHRLSGQCRAKRQLHILDSCFSGAFGRPLGPKDAQGVQKDDVLGYATAQDTEAAGKGLVVLTASTAFQYSFEGTQVTGAAQPSVFTKHLVEGLRTGEADLGGDGFIDEDELYRFVFNKTKQELPSQSPQRWVVGGVGELHVARSKLIRPLPLPADLQDAVMSENRYVLVGAVTQLKKVIAQGTSKGQALSAEKALRRLAEHDSMTVREAANAALSEITAPPSSVDRSPRDVPTSIASASESLPAIDIRVSSRIRQFLVPLSIAAAFVVIGGFFRVYFEREQTSGIKEESTKIKIEVPKEGQPSAQDPNHLPSQEAKASGVSGTDSKPPPTSEERLPLKKEENSPPPFDDGKGAILSTAAKAELDALLAKLHGLDIDSINAVGYTSSVGTPVGNDRLAKQRAQAAKTYLVTKGIEADKIYVQWRGSLAPIASNDTEEGRAKNRRVEIGAAAWKPKEGTNGREEIQFEAYVHF